MTVQEVFGPLLFPAASGIAVLAVVLMLLHVARVYGSSPKRVPYGIGPDGRPRGSMPKQWLWTGPAVVAAVVALLGVVLFFVDRPRDDQRPLLALVMIACAEAAALVAWNVDRQIEFARKQTFRIAPGRLIRNMLPLLATIVLLIALSIRMG